MEPRASRLAVFVVLPLLIGSFATSTPAAESTRPVPANQGLSCPAERDVPLIPSNPELCEELAPVIRDPSGLPLGEYEAKLGDFLRNWCHRDADSGWKRDKLVRDTGPYVASFDGTKWTGDYRGTHAPVVIWYSKEMIAWLKANRPAEGAAPAAPAPIPDGAVMIKEMYPKPAAACAGVDPLRLLPTSGAAVMVRDREASHDGWFWGWFGWSGWDPDWPAGPNNRLPFMGFGQYCVNCHASARDGLTFADLANVEGEPGRPLVFLSQHFFGGDSSPEHHRLVTLPGDDARRLGQPLYSENPAVAALLPSHDPGPGFAGVSKLPSQTYDNVWVGAGGPTAAHEFVTSDQCLGCHDAGGTGLQFDMTAPDPQGSGKLLNLSPYATWSASPMGLAGRDPVFFAMLASETDTFHPEASEIVQDTCLGCHGFNGQRQFKIDRVHGTGGAPPSDEECREQPYLREYVSAVPWPHGNPGEPLARYGALSRDGISCTACHRTLVGVGDGPALDLPENRCVKSRQDFLNPEVEGFARTFTGSFLVGPPDELYGPFEDPRVLPMEHAIGNTPVHTQDIRASEVCGSCHTVHLPVMVGKDVIDHTYEQTTYPEWAFSAYRTGSTPQGPLPGGAGAKAESCQGCHMPSADRDGTPYRSKIAGIQEFTNFPQAEHNLGPEEIDLPVREGFARHTLVGLNVFFLKMAQQFPDVLGIRTQDPMLVSLGVDPLVTAEQAMLDQASYDTATLTVPEAKTGGGRLTATVAVESRVGHKLPSGVGFRRAFLELRVLDAQGRLLWASGRTNRAGVLVDETGTPIAGELWWNGDCSALLHPDELVYQPHYQTVRRQDQAQIYQELVTAPPGPDADCGLDATPVPPFTTSFLSICGHVKDNRILPEGFLPLAERIEIARALGAKDDLASESGAHGVGGDTDYDTGGGDTVSYEIDLAELARPPASVRATLFYQAMPPYFLQDRFCTSDSDDTKRLQFLAGHLSLDGTEAQDWKLEIVSSELVPVAREDSGGYAETAAAGR
jgi:hypothetical protein